jgi:hypothetical protein
MPHVRIALLGVTALGLLTPLAVPVAIAQHIDRYGNVDPAVREWYRTRTLTPAAEKRIGFKSCCDAGDVVLTKFRAEGDQWFWLDGDQWKLVPPDIIHWGDVTPTGEPILFAVAGKEVCFFPGAGGT